MERALTDNLTGEGSRVPLMDEETEKALLSLCIRKIEVLNDVVSKKIVKEDFYDKRNALIFDAIEDLYINNGKIDRINICSNLEKAGKLNAAGGKEYVFAVANSIAVASNVDSYITIVREKSSLRQLLSALQEYEKLASSGMSSVNDVVDLTINTLTKMREAPEGVGFEMLDSILKRNLTDIHKAIQGKDKGEIFKTGFSGLDMKLGGLRPGTLNIIAARPGVGKTALVINIATNIATIWKKPVDIFSLEMSKSEIGNRILASRSKADVSKLQRANIKPEEEEELTDVFRKLAGIPIYIDDNPLVNPVTMRSTCQELRARNELGLIVVDYLQLMTMPSKNNNTSRQQEVSDISRSLKVLAKDLGVPIIALSQLSRGTEKREDHTPMLSDLRDSGAIEQDADSVIFIDREDYRKNGETPPPIQDARIIIAKNRHGETGTIRLKWYGAKTMFYEENRRSDPQEPGSGSAYTRTKDADSSASDYSFEDPQEAPPPFDNPEYVPDDSAMSDNDDFFADSSDELPESF